MMAMVSQRLIAGARLLRTGGMLVPCRSAAPTLKVSPVNFASRTFATQKSRTSTSKVIVVSSVVGAGVGLLVAGYEWYVHKNQVSLEGKEDVVQFLDKLPDVPVMRTIHNPSDRSDLNLILFQFQTCPFCCKVRTFLDANGFSYSVVEVDAVLRQSIRWSNYKKVPLLLAKCKDGRYVQLTDSSMIVSALSSFLKNPGSDIGEIAKFYPSVKFAGDDGKMKSEILNKYFLMLQKPSKNKEEADEERKWREWADNHLVHLISPNVCRTIGEAFRTFEWFSETGEWDHHFPRWERNLMVYVGATAMYLISKRLKKRHGLTDDVRGHIYDACDKWIGELDRKKTKFHGGSKPDLADLAVFGVLNSMEGCTAFKDMLKHTRIGDWFYAMRSVVNTKKGMVISAEGLPVGVI